MTGERRRSLKRRTYSATESELYVADVMEFLVSLARVYEKDKIGNAELGEGLRVVARALRPYSDRLVMELPGAIGGKVPSSAKMRTALVNPETSLPEDLESVSQESIEEVLRDERYTKVQLAELGGRRFGMSRAKLMRLRRDKAIESIRAALEHERSLDAIAMEARRGKGPAEKRP